MKKQLFTLMTVILLLFSFSTGALAEDGGTDVKELDISTSPHKLFFNLKNMKPGDRITKQLEIMNNGTADFQYEFSNTFKGGSEMFYNALFLTVIGREGTLFEGKLKDFERLDARPLSSGESEQLTFTVLFPYELGNEYQGLSSEFQFKLYVDGTLGGVLPVSGPKLPSTATEYFNLLLYGFAFIVGGLWMYKYIGKKSKFPTEEMGP